VEHVSVPLRLPLILLGIAVVVAIVTFLLHKIKIRWIKYIPAVVLLLFTILMIIMSQGSTGEGMQDLGWVLMAILSISGAVGGGVTAIVLDLLDRKRS